MKTAFNCIILVGAVGIGLAAGFALRRHAAGRIDAGNADSAVATDASGRDGGPATRRAHAVKDDSPLATKLEHDLAMTSGVARWLCFLDALEKAGPNDFPRLMKLAAKDPAMLQLVAARWGSVAPHALYDYLATNFEKDFDRNLRDVAGNFICDWTKRDPDAAIAAMNEPGHVGMRDIWRHDVAATVVNNDAERGLKLFYDWHLESFGPRMNAINKWAAADPRHAAEFALQYPAGYVTQLTMEAVGKAWAKTDPPAALQFAAANPGEFGTALENATLKQWAGQDLNAAADWLAKADASTRNRLSASFVETWAKQDAASALTWSQENLTGSRLSQAVGSVLRGASEKDVAGAAALVTGMDPSAARAAGAASVAQKWFPEFAPGNTVPAKPEAIAWLGSLDTQSVRSALNQITWQWATADAKSMATFLQQLPSDNIPNYTDSVVARILARQHPQDALDWAASLPQDRGVNAGADAYSEWRRSQPDAAMNWFNDLPANDPRRQPFFEGAVRSLAWDPQSNDQLAAMNETEKAAARKVIEGMTLPDDRKARLLGALAAH
jgi:hypothetical protein